MKYVIVLVLGLIVGAGATIFILGIPRAMSAPGAKVQAPEAGGDPPGAASWGEPPPPRRFASRSPSPSRGGADGSNDPA